MTCINLPEKNCLVLSDEEQIENILQLKNFFCFSFILVVERSEYVRLVSCSEKGAMDLKEKKKVQWILIKKVNFLTTSILVSGRIGIRCPTQLTDYFISNQSTTSNKLTICISTRVSDSISK